MKSYILLLTIFILNKNTRAQDCWEIISAGGLHSIGLKSDGSLWAWGHNTHGQLGISKTSQPILKPIQVGNEKKWRIVNASEVNSFGIKTNGTLWGWGHNLHGSLGIGSVEIQLEPIQIGTDSNWKEIFTGCGFHCYAIKNDSSIWAWGFNSNGQLGDNSLKNIIEPVRFDKNKEWSKISVGFDHSIGLKFDGTLWTWGGNSHGQLGIGTNINEIKPKQIGIDTNWLDIAAGFGSNLALKKDGSLWAWGHNNNGQLGDGTNISKNIPIQIGNEQNWSKIYIRSSAYAIKKDGTLWAWGDNYNGNLANGSVINENIPKQIGHDSKWNRISASFHIFGTKNDKSIFTWGYNSYGQLGVNNTVNQNQLFHFNTFNCNSLIQNANREAINILPNPFYSKITIYAQNEINVKGYIFNEIGQRVFTFYINKENNHFDLSFLHKGIYKVLFIKNDQILSYKTIVKQ